MLSTLCYSLSSVVLSQLEPNKIQQLPQTKSNKFKAVLIFEETVAMRTQDLELKK
jgi:hypothetical protein